ncbi:MAG: 5'/3'-nucleotidase SurE [Burkholderiaceae bacterium]
MPLARSTRPLLGAFIASAMALILASPASAADAPAPRKLDILLSNDDGVGAANLLALADALRKSGHRVVIAAPCHDASGSGALVHLLKPIKPVSKDCRGGKVKVGAPGYGPVDAADPSIQYVDGSPLMAAIYGMQVLAQQQWQKGPDLVISGPNEGNNTGLVLPSSGTLAIVTHALQRRIPAIGISADRDTRKDPAASAAVAALVAPMIDTLVAGDGPLPDSVGLNINVPPLKEGTPAVALSRVGRGTKYLGVFAPNLSEDPLGKRFKMTSTDAGISVRPFKPESEDEEEAVVQSGRVAISFVQGGYDADADNSAGIAAWRERVMRLIAR